MVGSAPLRRTPRFLVPALLEDAFRRAYRRARGVFHRGDRVECPCCGGRFRAFLPFGVIRRANALCPGCGALERHRLLWLYLERSTGVLTEPLRLLHLAPEPWLSSQLRRLPGLDYTSIDLESRQVMASMDATRLAFRDRCFDVVLCLHVLEHIPDDLAAMRELLRVLKPGGWGILQSPFDAERPETFEDWTVTSPRDRERIFGQRDHVRIYGRDYVARLRSAGFEVEESTFARELPAQDAERYGVLRDETLTICRRPGTS